MTTRMNNPNTQLQQFYNQTMWR